MARGLLTDLLQDNRFWLMDVTLVEGLTTPLFSPLAGFSAVTMPEVTVEQQEIPTGNGIFAKTVAKGGSVGPITLSRGVTFSNSDFWRWTVAALTGDPNQALFGAPLLGGGTHRRDLMLLHLFNRFLGDRSGIGIASAAVNLVNQPVVGIPETASRAVFNTPEESLKIPARAFLLTGCVPTRYKPGSDFDASSGQVSVQEMEFAVEGFEEISLAG